MLPSVGEQGLGAEGGSEVSSLTEKVLSTQYRWGIRKALIEGGRYI